jgi:hypothetical protein
MEKYPLSPPVVDREVQRRVFREVPDSGDNTNPSPTPIL